MQNPVQTKIYYVPTKSNELFASKMGARPEFKGRFVKLPPDDLCGPGLRGCLERDARLDELRNINGKAAFIWGDGFKHDESHHFTISVQGLKLKINFDRHDDCGKESGPIDYANHMRYCPEKCTVVTPPLLEPVWDDDSYGMRCPQLAPEDFKRLFAQAVEYASSNTCGPGSIAVTVDCDLFYGFPALYTFSAPFDTGISPGMVAGFIKDFRAKIVRLDIGGLMQEMRDFDLLESTVPGYPKNSLNHLHVFSAANGFVKTGISPDSANLPFDRSAFGSFDPYGNPSRRLFPGKDGNDYLIDHRPGRFEVFKTMDRNAYRMIASFAFNAYAEILSAFLESG